MNSTKIRAFNALDFIRLSIKYGDAYFEKNRKFVDFNDIKTTLIAQTNTPKDPRFPARNRLFENKSIIASSTWIQLFFYYTLHSIDTPVQLTSS
jgi:hypothetical protein